MGFVALFVRAKLRQKIVSDRGKSRWRSIIKVPFQIWDFGHFKIMLYPSPAWITFFKYTWTLHDYQTSWSSTSCNSPMICTACCLSERSFAFWFSLCTTGGWQTSDWREYCSAFSWCNRTIFTPDGCAYCPLVFIVVGTQLQIMITYSSSWMSISRLSESKPSLRMACSQKASSTPTLVALGACCRSIDFVIRLDIPPKFEKRSHLGVSDCENSSMVKIIAVVPSKCENRCVLFSIFLYKLVDKVNRVDVKIPASQNWRIFWLFLKVFMKKQKKGKLRFPH